MGLKIGDYCKLREDIDHTTSLFLKHDGDIDYVVMGFFEYWKDSYVIIYGTTYSGGHSGYWAYSDTTDHLGNVIVPDLKKDANHYFFVEKSKLKKTRSPIKISNVRLKQIIENGFKNR